MIPALAIGAFMAGGVLGLWLALRGAGLGFLVGLGLLVVLFALFNWLPRDDTDYARFGLIIAAYLGCLPGAAGMLGGGLGGWLFRRHRARF